jgi:hypothetical protein
MVIYIKNNCPCLISHKFKKLDRWFLFSDYYTLSNYKYNETWELHEFDLNDEQGCIGSYGIYDADWKLNVEEKNLVESES